jgi:peptidoglycan/xylan/chitin deacetylase (PgdA/CDA1 family)
MKGLILALTLWLAGGGALAAEDWSVPVLCYHQFGEEKKGNPFKMSPARFEEEISYLSRAGYHAVTLAALGQALEGKAGLPPKPVCITIDDGFDTGWTVAGPILKKYGFTASYFLQAKLQGRRRRLSWDQCRQLEKEGFEAASHTCYHSNLGKPLPGETVEAYGKRLNEEIFESKKILERELGHPVDWLAYPYGAYNPRVEAEVRKAGYRYALTVTPGKVAPGTPRYRLNRLLIMNPVRLVTFVKELNFRPVPLEISGLAEGSQWVQGTDHKVTLKFGEGVRPMRIWLEVGPHLLALRPAGDSWTCTLPGTLKPGFHFFAVNDAGVQPPRQSQWLFQVIRPEWAPFMKEEN